MNTDWQCQSSSDCASGSICCGNAPGLPQHDPGCSTYFVSAFTGTTCVAASMCPAGSFEICEQTGGTDCHNGAGVCSPLKAKGAQVGWCGQN